MQVSSAIISFKLDEGDTLKPLVETQGFSKPAKTIVGNVTRRDKWMFSAGVEIERIQDLAFVTIYLNTVNEIDEAVREVCKVLREVGLVP